MTPNRDRLLSDEGLIITVRCGVCGCEPIGGRCRCVHPEPDPRLVEAIRVKCAEIADAVGEDWFCEPCQAVNAVLRNKCRFCKRTRALADAPDTNTVGEE